MISSTEEPELAEEVFHMDEFLTAHPQNSPSISASQPMSQNRNSNPARYAKRSPMSRRDSSSASPKNGNMPIYASSRPVLSVCFLNTMGLILLACTVNGLDQMVALSGQAPVGALYRGHVSF